jgi:hypothetical protein
MRKVVQNHETIETYDTYVVSRNNSWEASKEVLAVDAFFRRLEARGPTFLAVASGDFGTTAASCEGGFLTIGASATGAVEGNFFGSSSSLIKEAKVEHFVQAEQKEELKQKLARKLMSRGRQRALLPPPEQGPPRPHSCE